MRRGLRVLRPAWRAAWVIVVLGGGVTAAVTWPTGWSSSAWPLPLWQRFDQLSRDGLAPVALLAAVVAVHAVPFGARSVVDGPWASRSPRDRVIGPLIILVGATWTAALLGLLPRAAATAMGAIDGGPDVVQLVVGAVSLAIWPAVGLASRVVVRRPVAATVVALLVAVAVLFGPATMNVNSARDTAFSTLSVGPFWGVAFPPLGWRLDSTTGLARVVFFALVVAAVVTILYAYASSSAYRGVALGRSATACLLVVVAGAGMLWAQPSLVQPDRATPICHHPTSKWTVCVHPALAPVLPTVEDRLVALLNLTGDNRSGAVLGWGTSEAVAGDADVVITDLAALSIPKEAFTTAITTTLAHELTGWPACLQRLEALEPGGNIPNALHAATNVQEALVESLTARVSGSGGPHPFGSMTNAELRKWLAKNSDAVLACESRMPK